MTMELETHEALRRALGARRLDPELLRESAIAIADPGGDHLSARVRYNLACYYADSRQERLAFAQLRLIAADESLAQRAQTDPAFKTMRADRMNWAGVFGGTNALAGLTAIGHVNATKLAATDLGSPQQFVEGTGTAAKRRKIASNVGVPTEMVLRWREAVLLSLLDGVGGAGSNLLTDANIETLKGLADWPSPDTLSLLLGAINAVTDRMPSSPDGKVSAAWIEAAKKYLAANPP